MHYTWFLLLSSAYIGTTCTSQNKTIHREKEEKITVTQAFAKERLDSLAPGIPAYTRSTLQYAQEGAPFLQLTFGKPSIITRSSTLQTWGHYQFPTLFSGIDSGFVVKIHYAPDAVASYGKSDYIYAFSNDGIRWDTIIAPEGQQEHRIAEGIVLANGDRLKIVTPKNILVQDLSLPKPVAQQGNYTFYRYHDLPESRKGIFLARMKKGEQVWKKEKAALIDNDALRYSYQGMFPVVWWGDIHRTKDDALLAGIYPGYYVDDQGQAQTKSGIFFYRSTDEGKSWKIYSRIPYTWDAKLQPKGSAFGGFTEPTFETLQDGSYYCVMRTTDLENGPLYAARSTDEGKTWSTPQAIAPAGVLPRLLQLENGILVLSSGRPGVQLRFSSNQGKTWSKAFEQVSYDPIKGIDWYTSCGYTSLLPIGPDACYLIYSDFFNMDESGKLRKAIKIRKITATSP